MKKFLPIIIILLLLILGVAGYFLMSNKKKPPTTVPLTKNSLMDLITQGKNVSCSFDTIMGTTESSGTVYVSGKNTRVDFSTTNDGKKNTGSMIRDENFSYVWGMGMAQGIKMKNTSVESPSGSAQSKQYFDPTSKVDYKCQSWSPDNSMFKPPAEVKFSEFSIPVSQQAGSTGNVTPGNQSACAACNNLSGQAKTMCLTQLNCQ